MCNCHSYNWDVGDQPSEILDPNEFFNWDSPAKDVCIDACIVDQIKHLWLHGVWTGGSCCGHNKRNPNVVLSHHSDADKARQLLKLSDPDREWDVYAWKLVEVGV